MNRKFFLYFEMLFIFQTSIVYCQDINIEYINNSNRPIGFFEIIYKDDSTKTHAFQLFVERDKHHNLTRAKENIIRLDVIAIDNYTKDTLVTKSFDRNELDNNITIDIEKTGINKLLPDLIPLPFLQVSMKSYKKILRIQDTIDIKLTNNEKIKGTIKYFDKESITIVKEKTNEKTIISRKNIKGIKINDVLFAAGARVYFGKYSKYEELENKKFKIVRQVLIKEPNGHFHYEWKE
jgi:hypothetical protein